MFAFVTVNLVRVSAYFPVLTRQIGKTWGFHSGTNMIQFLGDMTLCRIVENYWRFDELAAIIWSVQIVKEPC